MKRPLLVPQASPSIVWIRLAVGLIFATQGLLKYLDPNMGVNRFTRIGFPVPAFTAHSGVVAPEKRSTAFGVFDTAFGIAWFAGSAVMGFVYDRSILGLVVLSVGLQLAALPIFFAAARRSPFSTPAGREGRTS